MYSSPLPIAPDSYRDPFSAVAKKGVTIELYYKTIPLFARAERGNKRG